MASQVPNPCGSLIALAAFPSISESVVCRLGRCRALQRRYREKQNAPSVSKEAQLFRFGASGIIAESVPCVLMIVRYSPDLLALNSCSLRSRGEALRASSVPGVLGRLPGMPGSCSPESPKMFLLFFKLFTADSPEKLKEESAKAGVAAEEFEAFMQFVAVFFGNMGNYLSFGDTKFVPRCEASSVAAIVAASSDKVLR